MPSRFPKPHTTLRIRNHAFRFYLGDCLDVLAALPAHSLDAVVTSPPYNLGIQYRTYEDSLPQARYLEWTGAWVERTAAALAPKGSLFLNVGAKPTDPGRPWTWRRPRADRSPRHRREVSGRVEHRPVAGGG